MRLIMWGHCGLQIAQSSKNFFGKVQSVFVWMNAENVDMIRVIVSVCARVKNMSMCIFIIA
jgi:hypothetical protein